MSRHGDKIRKRKDGRWEGRYKIGNDSSGKTIYKSLYGHSYAEVRTKIENIWQHKHEESTDIKQMVMRDVALLWLESSHQKNKGATETKYEFLIYKHIIPDLGNMLISEITVQSANKYCENKLNGSESQKPLSNSYVRSIMLIITSIINFAVQENWCRPLTATIYKPTIEKKDIRILCPSEQCILENFIRQNMTPLNFGILLSLYTGMRIGEVCALRWTDVDLVSQTIYIRSTIARVSDKEGANKTKLIIDSPKTLASKRIIPIPELLMPEFLKIQEKSSSSFVISDHDCFVNPRTYEYQFHKALNQCGISAVNYHALRHTFATRCIEVGVDVKTLSEILGHANVNITLNTYVHPSMELKKTQINKLSVIYA